MKTIFVALTILLLSSTKAISQPEHLSEECVPKLAEGFNFLKTYKIEALDSTKFSVEYSYVFAKGTQYMIRICSAVQPSEIVVTVYDSQRNQVACNKTDGRCVDAIVYSCSSTGIYYMKYTSNTKHASNALTVNCANSILGFKRVEIVIDTK